MPSCTRRAWLGLVASLAFAQTPALLDVLGPELHRNYRILKEKADPAAYFISYAVTEEESDSLAATLGALQSAGHAHNRYLDVSVRVGSPKMDNYRRVSGERVRFAGGVPITVDDTADAIRRRLWLETDRVYRLAAERLIKIRSDAQVKVAEEASSADFSAEEPAVFSQPPPPLRLVSQDWIARLRKWSVAFARHRDVLNSQVTFSARRETKYLVTTEGTRLASGRLFFRVAMAAYAKAPDGMDLVTQESFESDDLSRLPQDEEILRAVDRVAQDLTGLVKAPLVEPFVGPAILSGRAAGVFFHEIFGHRIEGHRQKDPSEGQTFTKNVGQRVLPDFLSVIFDPTRRSAAGADLNGWYLYDDEGVKARRTPVVDQGVLKTFLMSRSPIPGFDRSNGHGRKQPGAEPVSRQSNLFVESSNQVPESRLRDLLIQEIRRQNKPYGLYFKQVTGGFTNTARAGLQAFAVIPLVVYRVYPDGRPDELVRGVDIVGTPLASFSKILATSDRPEVFNGACGAESGSVPVAAVSPALLVSEIEVQKKTKSLDRPPLLPAPGL